MRHSLTALALCACAISPPGFAEDLSPEFDTLNFQFL